MLISIKEAELILVLLSLIDMAPVGVDCHGHDFVAIENGCFPARHREDVEKAVLAWRGCQHVKKKQSHAALDVAISPPFICKFLWMPSKSPNDKLLWYVIMHITFVISAFIMGWLD